MARAPTVVAVILGAVGAWALVSFVGSDGAAEPEVHARIDGPVLVSDAHWEAGMAALIRGPVRLVGDCLFIGSAPVIWPTGTTWDDEADAVVLNDGTLVAVGATVSGGGGSLSAADVAGVFNEELADAVRACAPNGRSAASVFNPDQRLQVSNRKPTNGG
ncbi:hypothetical protein [Nocardioides sp.]|uniref:hypothetical protein n=1 Tax=Nocardioides sp. TaxID=35761 RepID=UPI0031FE7E17